MTIEETLTANDAKAQLAEVGVTEADLVIDNSDLLAFYLNDSNGCEYACRFGVHHGEWLAYAEVCGAPNAVILTCKTLDDLCKGLNTLSPKKDCLHTNNPRRAYIEAKDFDGVLTGFAPDDIVEIVTCDDCDGES